MNRLVRNTSDAGVEQRFRQRFARREVKIGKKNLAAPQHRPLWRQRFFHFHDHVRPLKNLLRRFDDLRAAFDVFLIGITGTDAGIFLHENGMPARDERLSAGRKQADALLLLFDFFGNADGHGRNLIT